MAMAARTAGSYSSRNRIVIGFMAGLSIVLAATVLLHGGNTYPGGLFGLLQQHPDFPRARHAQSLLLGPPQTGASYKDAPSTNAIPVALTGLAGELQPAEGDSAHAVTSVASQREDAVSPVEQAAVLSAKRLPAEPAAVEVIDPAAASAIIIESNPLDQAVLSDGISNPGAQANNSSKATALQVEEQGPDAAESQQVQAVVSDPQVVAAIAAGLQKAINATTVRSIFINDLTSIRSIFQSTGPCRIQCWPRHQFVHICNPIFALSSVSGLG